MTFWKKKTGAESGVTTQDFLETHLNALSAWTVTAGADEYKQSIEYAYTDCYSGSSGTITDSDYWYRSGAYWYWQDLYTTVPGDQQTTSGSSVYNNNLNDKTNLTVWIHDTNPGSIMATDGSGQRAFLWVEPVRQTRPGKLGNASKGWAAGDRFPHGKIFPFLQGNYLQMSGPPYRSITDSSIDTCNHTFYLMDPTNDGVRMSNVCWHSPGRTVSYAQPHPFMEWSGDDAQWYCAAGSYPHGDLDDQFVTIYDGTNYFLKSGDYTISSNFLFPLGPNDPGTY